VKVLVSNARKTKTARSVRITVHVRMKNAFAISTTMALFATSHAQKEKTGHPALIMVIATKPQVFATVMWTLAIPAVMLRS
jgi:hypothetical protein